MSTDIAMVSPEVAETKGERRRRRKEKKEGKQREEGDTSSKKRKRDHQPPPPADEAPTPPQLAAAEPAEQPRKKHKKDKQKHKADPQPSSSTKPPQPTTTLPSKGTIRKPKTTRQPESPFLQLTTSLYLPLSPCAYAFPLDGLCAEHISPHILTYYPPLHGILLSYSNPRLSEEPDDLIAQPPSSDDEDGKEAGGRVEKVLAKSYNEYATSFLWLTAEFTVFRPTRGTYITGQVGMQSESLLGLVCWNYFNAVVEREELPEDWRWVEGGDDYDVSTAGGYFVDGTGKSVKGILRFRVVDFEVNAGAESGVGTVSIVGSLKDVEER